MKLRTEKIETPSDRDIAAIATLIDGCNAADGTAYRYENNDDFRRDGEANTFLLRRKDKLVAAATIFAPRRDEGEVTAFTAPDERGRGHFRRLAHEIGTELADRGAESILFVNDRRSNVGKAAIEALKARFEFAEYEMEWSRTKETSARPLPRDLTVRPTETADVQRLARIHTVSFGEEDGTDFIRELLASETRTPHTILLDGYVIGMISAVEDENRYYIHGFCIDPDHRGKGYGTAVLREFVRRAHDRSSAKTIRLEVETENESALTLYTNLGFSVVSVFDYYRLRL